MAEDLYGRGASYPLRVGPTGGIAEAAGWDRIAQSITIILGTQHGERMMRPTFGCNLGSLAFAPNDAATANLARHLVESGLTRWEPRIELEDIEVANDHRGDRLVITVRYRIKGVQELRSLVFAFPLGQSAGGQPEQPS